MNIVDEFRRDHRRVLDKLVDGELGQHERRQLLSSLDDEPGAWRQCALAFLESQSLRWQMARIASEPILAQVTAPDRESNRVVSNQPSSSFAPVGAWLAVAASLFVAFGIGTRFSSFGDLVGPTASLVSKHDKESNEQAQAKAPALASSADDAHAPLRTLTLKPVGDENGALIELPIVESDADGAIAASAQPSALSGSLMRQFEKDGFAVDRQERLWPVDLPDGRRVLVPVEEVDIRSPEVQRL